VTSSVYIDLVSVVSIAMEYLLSMLMLKKLLQVIEVSVKWLKVSNTLKKFPPVYVSYNL